MTSPQQIEILDIRHFTARQLRPLLEGEAAIWCKRLRWDYITSTDLLLQYLDSRILPGFVALNRGRICGYTFCVYEGPKAVVGDIYADPGNNDPLAVTFHLARHLLDMLEAAPDIDRIEAQLLLFDSGILPAIFTGFKVFPRLFLEHDLQPSRSLPGAVALPPPQPFEICPWSEQFYQPAAALIQASYAGHIDSNINDQYRTLHGSLRFLHNVVRFPGCGTFDPMSSFILRERATNALAGIILCSRIASDVAHITQLCVAPAWRGRNLGGLLLGHCLAWLPAHRYRAITLTVSEANTPALGLYEAAGFTQRHRFDALALDKPPRRGFLNLISHR